MSDLAAVPDPSASVIRVRPRVTLGLVSAQHALIHAQTALLPLVFIPVMRPTASASSRSACSSPSGTSSPA